MGYVIIPKPPFSSLEGINCQFWLVVDICVICQVPPIGRRYDRSVRRVDSAQPRPTLPEGLVHSSEVSFARAGDSVFAIIFLCFSHIKKFYDELSRERKCFQSIRTVWDISRDDRASIATCSLLTVTDRLKNNYSIDDECWLYSARVIHFLFHKHSNS